MNKSKLLLTILIILLFFTPFLVMGYAKDKPNYVGINEGDAYIWRTEFDKDPFEDYAVDLGYSDEDAEATADYLFEYLEVDDDAEGWRVYILELRDEKDRDYKNDEIDYIPFLYNFYETDDWDEKDWDKEEDNARGEIPEFDEDYYVDHMGRANGLWGWFVGTDADWDDLADAFEDELEDDNEEGSADDEESLFFFTSYECGISTEWDVQNTTETEEFETQTRFTRNGVLLYYEWTYDGDTIILIELEFAYFHENWWWMFLIALGIGVLALVVVIIIIKKKRA